MGRPRILFISYGFPQPGSGLGARTDLFLRAMSKVGDVCFVFRTPLTIDKDDIQHISRLSNRFVPIPYESFLWRSPLTRLIESDKRALKIFPLLFAVKPVYINSNWLAKNKSMVLDKFLARLEPEAYDLIHIGRLYMADSVAKFVSRSKEHGVTITLDLDDIESIAVERFIEGASMGPRTALGRILRRIDLWKLRAYEKRVLPKFNACIVCSEVDKQKIALLKLTDYPWVLENAVDTAYFSPEPHHRASNGDILFVGNMSYGPNVDAVHYFARNILPIIQNKMPAIRFTIVGKEPVSSIRALAGGNSIVVAGEVADLRPYYRDAAIVIAPIRFGGGTRIKILEAMAMGKAVVCSTIAIEGIPVKNGQEAVIADEPNEYARSCMDLLKNGERAKEIGMNARGLVCHRFDRQHVEDKIAAFFEHVLSNAGTSQRSASNQTFA